MLYLNYFGAILFDSNSNNDVCQIVYSVLIFTTGIILLILSPYTVTEFDDWSEAFSTPMSFLMCTLVFISSMISRMIVIYNAKFKYQKYKTTLEGFEIYIPMNTIASKHIKYFSFAVISLCMGITIPINGLKLYYIFNNHANRILMTTYFGFYYIHNLNMIYTELHFAIQCFLVYTKFRDINEKLIQINDEQNYYNCNVRYPFTPSRVVTPSNDETPVPRDNIILYEKDFYCSKDKVSPLANTIELLRIKHWLTREAVNDLKCLFGFQIGLSIICLVSSSLFDIYTVVFYPKTTRTFDKPVFRSSLLFVGWMLQYSLRFCIIVITAHTAVKQAVKIKKFITEMNNRYLDCSTKEELHLFYYQLSICSPEFTIFDIFTLNNGIITSAIAAGSTYILILVQIHSDK